MPDDQQHNDWQHSFLVKDKSGGFTKVADDEQLDLSTASEKPSAPPPPPTPPAPPSPKPAMPSVAPPPKPTAPKPLVPQPPIGQQGPAPAPTFDESDEAEIKKHAESLKRMAAQSGPDLSGTTQSIADRIIQQLHLSFIDDILAKRFSKVVESRLRNLRNSIETTDVLTRPTKIGGLGLSPEQAEQIIAMLESETAGIQKPSPRPASSAPTPTPRTVQKTDLFASAPPAFVPRPGGAAPAQPTATLPPRTPSPVPTPPPAPLKPQPPQTPTPAADASPHELYGQPAEEMPRIRPLQPHKPHVIDIKQPPQTVGPVEEIRQIDLKEFRRLGTNPGESAEKVKEKIELLEEESWEIRIDGIKAWKQCPLFALYVSIGRESLERDMSVEEVITKRRGEEKEFILPEEFTAITELNMSLQI